MSPTATQSHMTCVIQYSKCVRCASGPRFHRRRKKRVVIFGHEYLINKNIYYSSSMKGVETNVNYYYIYS